MDEGLDILITRVIDGRAGREDWRALEARGESDPGVWRSLALAQRDDQVLRETVSRLAEAADGVDLDGAEELDGAGAARARFHVGERTRRVATWGGWAAAALVGLAFLTHPQDFSGNRGQEAGHASGVLSAAEALSQYLTQGRKEGTVISEMPEKVLMNAQPAAQGEGYDVVYLRLIMEKDHVPDLYRFTHDELGHEVPMKLTIPANPAPAADASGPM